MKIKHKKYLNACLVLLGWLLVSASTAGAADGFKVDPVHSGVGFRIKHLGVAYVQGRFNNLAGSFTFDDKTGRLDAVEASVRVEDVDTFNSKRDAHLKSPDFFDAAKFPLITFSSDTVEKTGETTWEVSGKLSLHGVTRPIKVSVKLIGSGFDPWGGFRAGFETAFTVKRSDFGITHMLGSVGDEVHLTVGIEGIRQ